MKLLYAVVMAATLAACTSTGPSVDECAAYDTGAMRGYCYASKEVTAARRAVAASLRDGSITLDQAIRARDTLSRADSVLDEVERLIIVRQDGDAQLLLVTFREILAERGL